MDIRVHFVDGMRLGGKDTRRVIGWNDVGGQLPLAVSEAHTARTHSNAWIQESAPQSRRLRSGLGWSRGLESVLSAAARNLTLDGSGYAAVRCRLRVSDCHQDTTRRLTCLRSISRTALRTRPGVPGVEGRTSLRGEEEPTGPVRGRLEVRSESNWRPDVKKGLPLDLVPLRRGSSALGLGTLSPCELFSMPRDGLRNAVTRRRLDECSSGKSDCERR